MFNICTCWLITFVRNINTTLKPHKATEWYTYTLRTKASLRLPRHQDAFIRTSNDWSWTVLIAHSAVSIMKWTSCNKWHSYAEALLYCVWTSRQNSHFLCIPTNCMWNTQTHSITACPHSTVHIMFYIDVVYIYLYGCSVQQFIVSY